MRIISPTGNSAVPEHARPPRRSQAAFTFIEILVAVGVLASCIPFVSRIFLGSIVAQTVVRHRARADALIEEKKEAIRSLIDGKNIVLTYSDEETVEGSPSYAVAYTITKKEEYGGFYCADITITWREGEKPYALRRALYLRRAL